MDLIPALSKMPILQVELSFLAKQSPYLNQDRGAIWRSVLGMQLLRHHCPSHSSRGCQCPIERPCLYARLFLNPIPPDSQVMRQYTNAPQPYTLSTCAGQRIDDNLWQTTLLVSLFGQACEAQTEVIIALIRGAKAGIGPNREPLHLANQAVLKHKNSSSHCLDIEVLATSGKVEIQLLSPLKIKQQGRYCQAKDFTPRTFFAALQRRACMLSYFHQGLQVETGFQTRVQAAEALQWQRKKLHWQNSERFSQRQKQKIPLGGLVGRCLLDNSGLNDELRYLLNFGQHIGVGQHAVLGQGRYRLNWQTCQSQSDVEHAA